MRRSRRRCCRREPCVRPSNRTAILALFAAHLSRAIARNSSRRRPDPARALDRGPGAGAMRAMTETFPTLASKDELERGAVLAPRFDASGLIAAVTTHADTGEVLMLAWMN